MGEFISEHFAAGWKKIGTFSYWMTTNSGGKSGGNVIAHFCTPDLKILHAVWGPEEPLEFLAQAKWAVELAEGLVSTPARDWKTVARMAHQQNPYRTRGGAWAGDRTSQTERYDHLMKKVLAPITPSAAELFLQLVNENASHDDWMDRLRRNPTGLLLEEWNGAAIPEPAW